MILTTLLASLVCSLHAPSPAQAGDEPVELGFGPMLVVDATAPGRRSPVVVDAIEAQLVRGTFAAPSEGLEVPRAEGEPLVWRSLEAGEDGWYQDGALRGGWGYTEVELDQPRTMILDARGHRRVYVNGEPRMGDVYALGLTKLPVSLKAGTNTFLFRGGRGRLKAKLTEAPRHPYLVEHDRVLPDVLPEDVGQHLVAGIRVGNPTSNWVEVMFVGSQRDGPSGTALLPPLSVVSVPLRFRVPAEVSELGEDQKFTVPLRLASNADGGDIGELELDVKRRDQKHKRTFISLVDGSVQYYAVTPPAASDPSRRPGFVLSLHGASVQATNQAYSYAPKDDLVVVAPTNRRPFGFDWEDWGRYDALEVFELAKADWDTDPLRQYLTGHSMGGHGTWNLGAHRPGTFAAIAPSAGWRDFWAYGGGGPEPLDPEIPLSVDHLLADAANPSRTLMLKENYLHHGIYVLHGDADQTVKVDQARYMRRVLAEYHPNFAYYERPGAGHWWGNQCMDWPPLFDFLRDNELPAPETVRRVAFATVNPAVLSKVHWVTIYSQLRSLELSRVECELEADERRIEVTTENVRTLVLDLSTFSQRRTVIKDGETKDTTILPPAEPITLVIDGQQSEVTWPVGDLTLIHVDDGWKVAPLPDLHHKNPDRAGPFKDAFRGHMVFVVGTQGDDARDALLLAKARFDAEAFGYRGNGSIEVRLDTDYDPLFADNNLRHVVLYGNADDHALWQPLLGDSPVQVRDGFVQVGERTSEGDDQVCLFVRPHPGSTTAAVAAIAPTGDAGARLALAPPYFVSGVGYPDWTLIGADMLEQGAEGIRAAGFFGHDWSLERGRSTWR